MAGENVLPPIPYATPMVDANGRVTHAWKSFLHELYRRAGGAVALDNLTLEELIDGVFDNLAITTNTISSTNTNGDIIFDPNGTGKVKFSDATASRLALFDSDKGLVSSTITETVAGYLDPSSSVQTQLNTKVTNPMTTGGDTIYGGASGVPTRLANGTVKYVYESGGGTAAPVWANNTSFTATRATSNQTGINPNDSAVKVAFNSASIDTDTDFDTTNNRYTVSVAGHYLFNASVSVAGTNVLANRYGLWLFKNGAFVSYLGGYLWPTAGTGFTIGGPSAIVSAAANDYFEVFLYGTGNNSASTLTVPSNGSSHFSGFRVR